MNKQPPALIRIDHDEYAARYLGHTADGRQFFLTNPFVPSEGGVGGREFIALYLFDQRGRFLEAHIDDLGTRASLDVDQARQITARRLQEIGPADYDWIEVQPFQIEQDGTVFGFIPRPPEDDDEEWWVTVEPGDYMAFQEPWDSGEYDT